MTDTLMFDYIIKNIEDIIIPQERLLFFEKLCLKNNFLDLYNNTCKDIHNKIYDLTYESIIKEYQDYKSSNLLIGDTREDRIISFIEKYAKDPEFAILFLKKYCVLEHLLKERIMDLFELVVDIIKNYVDDKVSLESLFNKKLGVIKKIYLSMGDLHNGKAVSIIIFENGKLVYKPHDSETDKFVKKLINFISIGVKNCCNFYFAKVLNFNNHSWQEFIERKDCTSMEEVHNYYYRAGVYLAAFYILSTTDLHFENMISYGEYPIFIDLETLVRGETLGSLKCENSKTYCNSILYTNMLPAPAENSIIDVNLSSIFTGRHKSSKLEDTYVVPDNDLDWAFVKKKIVLEGNNNNLLLNGHEVYPYIVEKDLIGGFKDALNFIYNKKVEFTNFIINEANDSMIIRQVLRATQVYAKFINASVHPDFLTSFEKRDKLFNMLFNNFTLGSYGFLRVQKEVNDLKKGYVPLFYTIFNEKNLYSSNKIICDNYFDESPKETVLRRISTLNTDLINYQVRFIQMSFLSIYGLKEVHSPSEAVNYTFREEKISFDYVKTILQEYVKSTVNNLISTDNANWSIIMPKIKGNGFVIDYMGNGLYETGGLIWFLAVYSKFFDSSYSVYPRGMLKALITKYTKDKLISNNIFDYSVYSGISSLIYLTYNFYKLYNDKYYFDSFREIALDVISHYLEIPLNKKVDTDFLNGFPGVLFLLSKIYFDEIKISSKEPIITKESLSILGDKFYDLILNTSNNFYGFAHGISGLGIVTAILYKITCNKKYLGLLKKLLILEKKSSPAINENFSWCRGESGVLLSRYIMLDYVDDNDLCKLIKDSMPNHKQDSIKLFFNMNQFCICHGIYGNIDIFNSIMKKTGQAFFKHLLYRKYFSDLTKIKWFEHSDYEYESFMLGSSGVAYVLMRLYKDIPSVLSLDIY